MFLFEIKVFVFIFCILTVLKNLFSLFKVMYMREGKVDNSTTNAICVGLAVSYIITILITGFE